MWTSILAPILIVMGVTLLVLCSFPIKNTIEDNTLTVNFIIGKKVIDVSGAKFLPVPDDVDEYFSGYFGVVVDDEIKPQVIKFKAWGRQRAYFNTLPLNASMKEVETYDDYSVFTCLIAPTWDLEMEFLQYNEMVEVLEPLSMRENMIEHIQNMLDLYCSN